MKSEHENKLDRVISRRYKARLMNNTKWREVFTCLARTEVRFRVAWVYRDETPSDTLHSVWLRIVGERGLLDPGIGGPFYYKEIEYVRIPRSYRIPKVMRGEVFGYQETGQDVDGLLEQLRGLGQLPLTVMDEYMEIRGYV